ncbi:MAG: methyltransferase [Candidatus Electrothrix scaldis]|nr:MAG: methyltransferase [Candidatus Electrothrix sp. GW3-3]
MVVQFDELHLYNNEGIPEKTPFSKLMCEALSQERPARLLDIGCGSGIVGIYALLNESSFVCFNDIQKDAIRLTQQNLRHHRIAESSYCLLNIPFQQIDPTEYQLDAVFFNPPQLPTDLVPITRYSDSRERVFRDGGADGRNLIDQFIEWLSDSLPARSRAYLGISSVLFIDNVLEYASQAGLAGIRKCVATVPLREVFYPAVEEMQEDERIGRELIWQGEQWKKKIYILEFRKS